MEKGTEEKKTKKEERKERKGTKRGTSWRDDKEQRERRERERGRIMVGERKGQESAKRSKDSKQHGLSVGTVLIGADVN